MILIASLRLARAFGRLAVGRVAHPEARLVAGRRRFVSGALSALFVNDTICLVFTPVLIDVARARGQSPVPYPAGLATASNIGSVATIVGNPQNMSRASRASRMSNLHGLSGLWRSSGWRLMRPFCAGCLRGVATAAPQPADPTHPSRDDCCKSADRGGRGPGRIHRRLRAGAGRSVGGRGVARLAQRQAGEALPCCRLGLAGALHRPVRRHWRRREGRPRSMVFRALRPIGITRSAA